IPPLPTSATMRYREASRVPGGKRPSSEDRLAEPAPSWPECGRIDDGETGASAYCTAAIVNASESLAGVPHDGQNRVSSVRARPHEEQVIGTLRRIVSSFRHGVTGTERECEFRSRTSPWSSAFGCSPGCF